MKNKLSILILLAIIMLPQVASAAWWNPFSWRVFNKVFGPKIEVFEAKKEITQEPINNTATTTEKSEIEKLREEIEELKKQNTKETPKTPSTQTKKEPTTIPKPTIATPTTSQNNQPIVVNKDILFADLIKKYTDFQSSIASERSGLKKNSSFYVEKQYFQFIDNLLVSINGDLGYLTSIKDWISRPSGIEEIYLAKFNKLNNDHATESKRYKTEYSQELDSKTKQAMIEYIKQHKYQLYEASVHVEAAGFLYEFDKIYGTNYAHDFESKKTQVETVEFANRFLIDQE